MKNENGKHYFSLDSPELTLYPDEQEILLQAGMIARVSSFKNGEGMIVFNLSTSEAMVYWYDMIITLCFVFSMFSSFLCHTFNAVKVFKLTENIENGG